MNCRKCSKIGFTLNGVYVEKPTSLYLDLLKKALTFYLWEGKVAATDFPRPEKGLKALGLKFIDSLLRKRGLQVAAVCDFDPDKRRNGLDWPLVADTMIGLKRLDNIQSCMEAVEKDGVPGDLIETGVWRGGAVIFMRAVLEDLGNKERMVWVADSFQGLPAPDPDNYPADRGSRFHQYSQLAVGEQEVVHNFERYGLYDQRVKLLKGWFSETLPKAPIQKLSLIRLDGDMYESTMDALTNLYPKLSPGGFVIVDDYAIDACRAAVDEYRKKMGITDKIVDIDQSSVFWRSTGVNK